MGCPYDYATNEIPFIHFGSGSAVLDCDWWRNFFKNGDGFPFS